MEFRELLMDWLSKISPAAAQRRNGKTNTCPICVAPLRRCGRNLFFVLALLLVPVPCFAQSRQMMRPADIVRVASVGDAQISPNGQWVVYTVSSIEEDKNVSTLWITRPGLESYTFPN